MIYLNEEFTCEHCKKHNPKAEKTCRNHCRHCLFSKHLDQDTPGDRLSQCQGLMEPVRIEHSGKKGFQILHECQKCHKQILNKCLPDDSIETITRIINIQNLA